MIFKHVYVLKFETNLPLGNMSCNVNKKEFCCTIIYPVLIWQVLKLIPVRVYHHNTFQILGVSKTDLTPTKSKTTLTKNKDNEGPDRSETLWTRVKKQ